MSRIPYYLLLVVCLIFVISLPKLVQYNQSIVFVMEELMGAIFLIIGFCVFKPLLKKITHKIDRRYPWKESMIQRILAELGIVLLFSILLTIGSLTIAWFYFDAYGTPEFYKIKAQLLEIEHDLFPEIYPFPHPHQLEPFSVFLYTLSIFGGSLFLFASLFVVEEYFIYYQLKQEEKIARAQEAKELALSKVYALQHQLNPHFMFNTLNVLSGLIHEDVDKADQFIKKLSEIYRYVLEQSEEVATTLAKEIKFAKAYIFLLKIRFEDKVEVNMEIEQSKFNWFLPSLSLELLIENAIKHNSLEAHHPLEIQIFVKDENLVVQNNILPRMDQVKSTGVGIKNLKKRLAALGIYRASFESNQEFYIATIPLINPQAWSEL